MSQSGSVGLSVAGDECVVCCHGALVDGLVGELREVILAARELASTVDVYAADITFVGRAGIGVLLADATRARMAGHRLGLVAPSAPVLVWVSHPSLSSVLDIRPEPPDGWADPCLRPAPEPPAQRRPSP